MEAGELRDRVQVLTLSKAGDQYQWAPSDAIWAKVELTGKTNLFSAVGIGARDALITLRRRPLCLHQALLWRGQHLFLTEVLPPEGSFMTARAAVVQPQTWTGQRFETGIDKDRQNRPSRKKLPPIRFPGIITEKYLGHQMDERHAATTTTFVLVTPKAVELSPGDLVSNLDTAKDKPYVVQVAHTLDQWKNEYEIARKEDV